METSLAEQSEGSSVTDVPEGTPVTELLTLLWLVATGLWTLYFLDGLLDARALIAVVEQDLGKPFGDPAAEIFDAEQWRMLREVFSGQGFGGRSISPIFSNWLLLGMGGFVTYLVGFPMLVQNVAKARFRTSSARLAAAMITVFLIHATLMVAFKDTIDIVSFFVLD